MNVYFYLKNSVQRYFICCLAFIYLHLLIDYFFLHRHRDGQPGGVQEYLHAVFLIIIKSLRLYNAYHADFWI